MTDDIPGQCGGLRCSYAQICSSAEGSWVQTEYSNAFTRIIRFENSRQFQCISFILLTSSPLLNSLASNTYSSLFVSYLISPFNFIVVKLSIWTCSLYDAITYYLRNLKESIYFLTEPETIYHGHDNYKLKNIYN